MKMISNVLKKQIEIWSKSHEVLALCARRLDDDEDMYDMEKIESG